MTPKDFGDLVSQVGFPIVVTFILLYQQIKTAESYYKLIEEVKTLVDNNTKVLEMIMDNQQIKHLVENNTKVLEHFTSGQNESN